MKKKKKKKVKHETYLVPFYLDLKKKKKEIGQAIVSTEPILQEFAEDYKEDQEDGANAVWMHSVIGLIFTDKHGRHKVISFTELANLRCPPIDFDTEYYEPKKNDGLNGKLLKIAAYIVTGERSWEAFAYERTLRYEITEEESED